MELTPTGGVIMSTRSGDLDPGVLVYLMRERKFDPAMIEDLADHLVSWGASTKIGFGPRNNPINDRASHCSVFVLAS